MDLMIRHFHLKKGSLYEPDALSELKAILDAIVDGDENESSA